MNKYESDHPETKRERERQSQKEKETEVMPFGKKKNGTDGIYWQDLKLCLPKP